MDDIPTEILVEIFAIAHQANLSLTKHNPLSIPISLSHVCRRWRDIILDFPDYWTQVHLRPTQYPSISQNILERSQSHGLHLSINLHYHPPTELLPKTFLSIFSATGIYKRMCSFTIIGRNALVSQLLAEFDGLYFAAMERLAIHQVQPVADISYVGPFTFNPRVFRTLVLEGVGLHITTAASLSGLTSLTLEKAGSNILDRGFLSNYPYPLSTPAMMQLVDLQLIRSPPDGGSIVDDFIPLFERSALARLTLADYSTYFPEPLFRSVLNPFSLQELVLNNVRGWAWLNLVRLINEIASLSQNGPPVPFPKVHTLELVDMGITHQLVILLLRAFPQLRLLRIDDTGVEGLVAALRDPTLCPLLTGFWVEGTEEPRPSAIMMIAAPP